jgi:hypothetical protein
MNGARVLSRFTPGALAAHLVDFKAKVCGIKRFGRRGSPKPRHPPPFIGKGQSWNERCFEPEIDPV